MKDMVIKGQGVRPQRTPSPRMLTINMILVKNVALDYRLLCGTGDSMKGHYLIQCN